MCARADELQKAWYPSVGDHIIASASYDSEWNLKCTEDRPCEQCIESDNIYIIDNKYDYAESVGGTHWFFNGMMCSKDGGCITNDTCCSVITKYGEREEYDKYGVYYKKSPMNHFLWIPTQEQLQDYITKKSMSTYLAVIENEDKFKIKEDMLQIIMNERFNKEWDNRINQWEERIQHSYIVKINTSK